MQGSHHDVRSTASRQSGMSAEEQDERRKQIREIMKDPKLSQLEKSRSIQSLMDGRRRSSGGTRSICSSTGSAGGGDYVSAMAQAAAVAADYYSSDEEGDAVMSAAPDDIYYGYEDYDDDHSVSSEITHTSNVSASNNNHNNNNNNPNNLMNQPIPPGTTYRQVHGRSLSLQDWNDNDRVIAAANASNNGFFVNNNPAYLSRLMEQSRPPCPHYERNCTIVSPCCGLAFGCRICHDECPVLPPPLALRKHCAGDWQYTNNNTKNRTERRRSMPADLGGGTDEENHHPIDRFAIREVICRECYTRQSSKTNYCIQCGIKFGGYHCNICNLWMATSENPYHCHDCGFCRVGGRENFRHCHDCGMCIDAILFDDHNCKSGKYMSNCPICQEDLFSSRHASHEMPCGHAIHWHCFKELTSYDTRCPVCKKTAETPEQMAATWSAISMGISLQPVPPDMARVVNIYCNDCELRETNRRWHFLGVRCNHCMSYNTAVEQIVMQGRDASEFLDRLEASQAALAAMVGVGGPGGIPTDILAGISSTSVLLGQTDDVMMDDAPSAQETSQGSSREQNEFSHMDSSS